MFDVAMADAPPADLPSGLAPVRELPRSYTELRPVLRAVAARTLGSALGHADVDDVVAETLRRVVEGAGRLREGEPLGPWAVGIAKHVALDQLRVRRREARRRPPSDEGSDLVDVVDPQPGPERLAMSAERFRALDQALAKLDEGPRTALVAFHVEGQSYQDISARLGVPMGTVATWIARSRKALGAMLADGDEARRPS
jgi:RNA polymerase sigma factor (sigma-70 family)